MASPSKDKNRARVLSDITRQVESLRDETIDCYRYLHQRPETSWMETGTAERVESVLAELGLRSRRMAGTGVVTDLGPDSGRPLRALRADMDAVNVDEATGLDFASGTPGVMHACGHDAHTAILLSTARVLKALETTLPGPVRLIFQPAEEVSPSGSTKLIEEGVLDGVAGICGLHVWPTLPSGTIGFREGPVTSDARAFECFLRGPGGHGARPHQTVDLIALAARIIPDLLDLPRSSLDPLIDPAMLSVGVVHAGESPNVLPAELRFGGTVRSFDKSVSEKLHERMDAVIGAHAGVAGADHELRRHAGPAAVVNDARLTRLARQLTSDLIGEAAVRALASASMGSEDFGHFTEHVPGVLIRLGSTAPGEPAHPLHSAHFRVDEAALATGVGILSALALVE